jgi:hypothetical protein
MPAMETRLNRHLLPEEDAIDDPDEDDVADPTVPGDLWYLARDPPGWRQDAKFRVVYS